ncbi:MAG: GntR family transcriptional regulator/MocR family aminotransferase [Gammaproteobacteria bacterium]
MRDQLFHLKPGSGANLQTQVREMMVRAILDGHIPPGRAVPSCRQLAGQLGVARNTVVVAYQRLVDEGYLSARERSGYYVSNDIAQGRAEVFDADSETADSRGIFAPHWSERLHARPSQQRNIQKPDDWQRHPYPFLCGQLDLALFPIVEWRECTREALTAQSLRRWAYDSFDSDDPDLIEQLRTRVLPRRGVWARSDEILVTLGAQHALYLTARLLMNAKTVVGVEEPGYTDARNIFASHSRHIRGLPIDECGLIPGEAVNACDYVFVTPSHQHPTTVTLNKPRRQRLLTNAVDCDYVIIEDDYESETNYVGKPTPALKSSDHNDRVIYIGSLSKTIAPGFRLGYMVAPAELIREARALRRLMLRHSPANNERAVALFLARGHHDSLVRRLSHAYKERWQAMGDALAKHFPESSRTPAFGGTAYWVCGPRSLDTCALKVRAQKQGILIEPGDIFFQQNDPPKHYFRLGFSSIPVERIEPGIAKLAELAHSMS